MDKYFSLEERIVKFLKNYNLEGLGIFFMESMIPFRRVVGHLIVFSEPFLSLFIHNQIISEIQELFYDKQKYESLYKLIQQSLGNKEESIEEKDGTIN